MGFIKVALKFVIPTLFQLRLSVKRSYNTLQTNIDRQNGRFLIICNRNITLKSNESSKRSEMFSSDDIHYEP